MGNCSLTANPSLDSSPLRARFPEYFTPANQLAFGEDCPWGSGSFGDVRLIEHRQLGIVAVKVANRNRSLLNEVATYLMYISPPQVPRSITDLRTRALSLTPAASINDDHIVRLLRFSEKRALQCETDPILVMEKADCSLNDIVGNGLDIIGTPALTQEARTRLAGVRGIHVPEEDAASLCTVSSKRMYEFIVQITLGARFLHNNPVQEKRVVHHDLKPANVLSFIGDDNIFLKLCDFGSAQPVATPIVPLPTTFPNEYLKAAATFDVYSIGVIIRTIARQRSSADPIPADQQHLLAALDRAEAVCTLREPSDRPADAGEIYKVLTWTGPGERTFAKAPKIPNGGNNNNNNGVESKLLEIVPSVYTPPEYWVACWRIQQQRKMQQLTLQSQQSSLDGVRQLWTNEKYLGLAFSKYYQQFAQELPWNPPSPSSMWISSKEITDPQNNLFQLVKSFCGMKTSISSVQFLSSGFCAASFLGLHDHVVSYPGEVLTGFRLETSPTGDAALRDLDARRQNKRDGTATHDIVLAWQHIASDDDLEVTLRAGPRPTARSKLAPTNVATSFFLDPAHATNGNVDSSGDGKLVLFAVAVARRARYLDTNNRVEYNFVGERVDALVGSNGEIFIENHLGALPIAVCGKVREEHL